ncbi:MAG TPA: hypothetical protein VE077_02820 [Candidatus Methylomirabilis sp.]|nr:hypothetical protein [Candidatus Methylomirabilis sp.]
MNRCAPIRRFCLALTLVIAALPSAILAEPASWGTQQQSQSAQPQQAQQPSAPPQDSAALKQKKVWTNDEVIALRTPADNYQVAKEAKEAADAAEAAKKAARAKEIKEAGLSVVLPSTAEETQRRIKAKQDDIAERQEELKRLSDELAEATPDEVPGRQKQIESIKVYLHRAHLELEVLEQHLQNVFKASRTEPTAVPPSVQNLR